MLLTVQALFQRKLPGAEIQLAATAPRHAAPRRAAPSLCACASPPSPPGPSFRGLQPLVGNNPWPPSPRARELRVSPGGWGQGPSGLRAAGRTGRGSGVGGWVGAPRTLRDRGSLQHLQNWSGGRRGRFCLKGPEFRVRTRPLRLTRSAGVPPLSGEGGAVLWPRVGSARAWSARWAHGGGGG